VKLHNFTPLTHLSASHPLTGRSSNCSFFTRAGALLLSPKATHRISANTKVGQRRALASPPTRSTPLAVPCRSLVRRHPREAHACNLQSTAYNRRSSLQVPNVIMCFSAHDEISCCSYFSLQILSSFSLCISVCRFSNTVSIREEKACAVDSEVSRDRYITYQAQAITTYPPAPRKIRISISTSHCTPALSLKSHHLEIFLFLYPP
jgi:hypothetical protein